MKKTFAILLVFVHVIATIGFCMNVHECGDSNSYKIANIHFGETCLCKHSHSSHKTDCCKDKNVIVKSNLIDLNRTINADFQFLIIEKFLISTATIFSFNGNTEFTTFIYLYLHPPNPSIHLNILFQVFRV